MMPITAAILAGGQSRRMGTDKAALLWKGMTLLERTARTAQSAGLSVLVVGRPQPVDWPLSLVQFLPDEIPGLGPLGGLVSALRTVDGPILALGCDMPLLTEAALQWLVAEAASLTLEHGLAVLREDQPEPLFSLYAPACCALGERRLATGRLSLRGLIAEDAFAQVPAPPWVAAQLVNVNTPEDFELLTAK